MRTPGIGSKGDATDMCLAYMAWGAWFEHGKLTRYELMVSSACNLALKFVQAKCAQEGNCLYSVMNLFVVKDRQKPGSAISRGVENSSLVTEGLQGSLGIVLVQDY